MNAAATALAALGVLFISGNTSRKTIGLIIVCLIVFMLFNAGGLQLHHGRFRSRDVKHDSRTGGGKHRGPGLMASRSACGSVRLVQDRAYRLAEGGHGRVKDSQAQRRTARTALDVAAASMARGASGIWLRAGSRLGLACRGTVYLLVGYLAFRLALA